MKFVMDERVKHRLTGVVVILSIAVIFLPAMMKKSNQHFEENVSVSLKLPNKPVQPVVSIPKQSEMFQSVKVAHVDITTEADDSYKSVIANAEPLSVNPAPARAKVTMPAKALIASAVLPVKVDSPAVVAVAKKDLSEKIVATASKNIQNLKQGYGVQLASFTQQRNAEYLVARLRKQGFVASYNKFSGKQGKFYQVVVGLVNQKNDAINLQKKLAINMQLNGFIIKTGVS